MGFSILGRVLHNAETDNVDGVELPVKGFGLLRLQVVAADSWDGTGTFQGYIDQANPVGLQGQQQDDGSQAIEAVGPTLNMVYLFDVSGLDWFKMPITGRSTGSVTVTARAVPL